MQNDSEILFQFIGGNFHEDWSFEFPSLEAAVLDFVRRAGAVYGQQVNEALLRLLSEPWTDQELEAKLLNEYGGNYVPSYVGESAREWLVQLSNELGRSIKGK